MPGFPIPGKEKERLKELRRLRFNDWGTSAALDDRISGPILVFLLKLRPAFASAPCAPSIKRRARSRTATSKP